MIGTKTQAKAMKPRSSRERVLIYGDELRRGRISVLKLAQRIGVIPERIRQLCRTLGLAVGCSSCGGVRKPRGRYCLLCADRIKRERARAGGKRYYRAKKLRALQKP